MRGSSWKRSTKGFTLGVTALALSLGLALALSVHADRTREADAPAEPVVDATLVVTAALSEAWSEIESGADRDGDGYIGAIAAHPFLGADGLPAAECATWVVNRATSPDDEPRYALRAVVGLPSLANPIVMRFAEAPVTWQLGPDGALAFASQAAVVRAPTDRVRFDAYVVAAAALAPRGVDRALIERAAAR